MAVLGPRLCMRPSLAAASGGHSSSRCTGLSPPRLAFFKKLYFCLHWVFVAARGLSLVVVSGDYSLLWCVGFSLQWLLLLQSMGSRHVGFSRCGTQAQ